MNISLLLHSTENQMITRMNDLYIINQHVVKFIEHMVIWMLFCSSRVANTSTCTLKQN